MEVKGILNSCKVQFHVELSTWISFRNTKILHCVYGKQTTDSLNVFNCHINMQWGRATSSTNISYGPSPTIQIEGEHRRYNY